MVFSYYLTIIPYWKTWLLLKLFRKKKQGCFYCGDLLDLEIFNPIQKYLQPLPIVAKNRKIQRQLREIGINAKLMPVFPDFVIMTRHAAWKFPVKQIKKIGLRHGPYHFKEFTDARNYNAFNLYIMTSSEDVRRGAKAGINSAIGLGYPKLDNAFNGTYSPLFLEELKLKHSLNKTKKTILFSATWEDSGMSAVNRWAGRLNELTEKYNVLVTLHPWTKPETREFIRHTEGVILIDDLNLIPWIMISDVCIGDTSSVIAEFSALNKPIVTFIVETGKRLTPEIKELIRSISLQIVDFEELKPALREITRGDRFSEARAEANRLMFNNLDGTAGIKTASAIVKLIPELKLPGVNYVFQKLD
ncbi:MAG: CDP-glycerol glycerophosphotransferase family protein [Candidatus Cloacimonetes bacterium]|nr:CDP-glycerol glycerophosphotransferase family protein [Candidatus Cloacimonadota bacterium]